MHKILTDAFTFEGKSKGDTVAVKELTEAGLNVEALVSAGHLSGNTPSTAKSEGAAE